MRPTWYFVLPTDRHLPSGGNRYNEQLIRALRRAGQPIDEVDFVTYRQARAHQTSGCFFVDSLFVRDLAQLPSLPTRSVRTVFILHHLASMDPPPGATAPPYWKDEQTAFATVDTFLVTSSFSESYLQDHSVRQPIIVVEPGVTVFPPAPPHCSDTVQVLMVANLVARKGILPWLAQLAELTKPTDVFRLTIVGRTDLEPAYATACQQLVRKHPVLSERVRLTGALPYAQVQQHYQRAHLFVSAARLETFGMALQEAQAARLPLLTLAGGYAERHVTTDTEGYVFTQLGEMAKFFVDWVRKPAELTRWRTQLAALPFTAPYNWDTAANQLIQQLQQQRDAP